MESQWTRSRLFF